MRSYWRASSFLLTSRYLEYLWTPGLTYESGLKLVIIPHDLLTTTVSRDIWNTAFGLKLEKNPLRRYVLSNIAHI
jgi:hypothetical protein